MHTGALVGQPYIQSNPSSWGNSNYYPNNDSPMLFADQPYHDKQYNIVGGRRSNRYRSNRRRSNRRSNRRRYRRTRRGGSLYRPVQPVTSAIRQMKYGSDVFASNLTGAYLPPDPSPLKQPIGK